MTKNITFRLDEEEYENLQAYAKANSENISQAIRSIIRIEVSRWLLKTPSRDLWQYFKN